MYIENLIEQIYALQKSNEEETIDLIYNTIDDWLSDGDVGKCVQLFDTIDVSRLTIQSMISLLTITLCAKDEIINRQDFFNKVKERLLLLDFERTNALLKGLE